MSVMASRVENRRSNCSLPVDIRLGFRRATSVRFGLVLFPVPALRILPDCVAPGLVADSSTDALHPFLRRYRAQKDSALPHRVAPPERIPQKVKLLFRQITDPRLTLVHRQLQLRHHHPHRGQSLLSSNSTADDEVIGIVHDVRSPTLFVPEFLPPQHEPSHVQITEQRTDRRSLRRTPTFVPIARTPM